MLWAIASRSTVRFKRFLALAMCLEIGAGAAVSQQAPKPGFEVASVKVNSSAEKRSTMRWQPGGRFVAVNVPLVSLVSIAYAVPVYQLESLPNWVTTVRFDITAQAKSEPTIDERSALLRDLLQDRFHAISRTEVKERDIYALVMARADGRLGPGLRPSTVQCPGVPDAAARAPLAPGARPKCAATLGIGSMTGDGVPLSNLIGMLAAQLQRPVVDRTGLSGRFDIDLTSSGVPTGTAAGGADDRPSVFTAIQEQLGLKLESQRGPVTLTVFDRIEMPTEN
jgi:uncharacterized protein (TIGR03435 family)